MIQSSNYSFISSNHSTDSKISLMSRQILCNEKFLFLKKLYFLQRFQKTLKKEIYNPNYKMQNCCNKINQSPENSYFFIYQLYNVCFLTLLLLYDLLHFHLYSISSSPIFIRKFTIIL